nr:unnamed protein product [Haemonchus contortus]
MRWSTSSKSPRYLKKNEMEQRGLFDFCLKRTDESFSSNSEPTLSEGCYSDESDSAIQGQLRCPNCMNDGEYECKKYDVESAIQASQQETLAYCEQFEKSNEKAQKRQELYQELDKEMKRLALEMSEKNLTEEQFHAAVLGKIAPTSCQRCAKHMKELSLSEAWLEFIVTWGQNIRKAARKQDKAYAKIDELVAVLLQLAKPLSALLGDAAQQEALVYAEQYEKSYEKARERKKLYQALEKEIKKYRLSKTKPADYKSAYCMDNPKPSSSVQREETPLLGM